MAVGQPGAKLTPIEEAVNKAIEERLLQSKKPKVTVAVIGHVDSGKSTTVGRITLMFTNNHLIFRDIGKFEKEAQNLKKESFVYAYVADTQKEERERGITISHSLQLLETDRYYINVYDCPGHRDFIANMSKVAVDIDLALVVLPCTNTDFEKITSTTGGSTVHDHCQITASFGCRRAAFLFNKFYTIPEDLMYKKYMEMMDVCYYTFVPYFKGVDAAAKALGAIAAEESKKEEEEMKRKEEAGKKAEAATKKSAKKAVKKVAAKKVVAKKVAVKKAAVETEKKTEEEMPKGPRKFVKPSFESESSFMFLPIEALEGDGICSVETLEKRKKIADQACWKHLSSGKPVKNSSSLIFEGYEIPNPRAELPKDHPYYEAEPKTLKIRVIEDALDTIIPRAIDYKRHFTTVIHSVITTIKGAGYIYTGRAESGVLVKGMRLCYFPPLTKATKGKAIIEIKQIQIQFKDVDSVMQGDNFGFKVDLKTQEKNLLSLKKGGMIYSEDFGYVSDTDYLYLEVFWFKTLGKTGITMNYSPTFQVHAASAAGKIIAIDEVIPLRTIKPSYNDPLSVSQLVTDEELENDETMSKFKSEYMSFCSGLAGGQDEENKEEIISPEANAVKTKRMVERRSYTILVKMESNIPALPYYRGHLSFSRLIIMDQNNAIGGGRVLNVFEAKDMSKMLEDYKATGNPYLSIPNQADAISKIKRSEEGSFHIDNREFPYYLPYRYHDTMKMADFFLTKKGGKKAGGKNKAK